MSRSHAVPYEEIHFLLSFKFFFENVKKKKERKICQINFIFMHFFYKGHEEIERANVSEDGDMYGSGFMLAR